MPSQFFFQKMNFLQERYSNVKYNSIKKGLLDKELHKEGGESYFKGGF